MSAVPWTRKVQTGTVRASVCRTTRKVPPLQSPAGTRTGASFTACRPPDGRWVSPTRLSILGESPPTSWALAIVSLDRLQKRRQLRTRHARLEATEAGRRRGDGERHQRNRGVSRLTTPGRGYCNRSHTYCAVPGVFRISRSSRDAGPWPHASQHGERSKAHGGRAARNTRVPGHGFSGILARSILFIFCVPNRTSFTATLKGGRCHEQR